MKKFQKLYTLKQIIKAQAEIAKYERLTNKRKHDPIFDTKLKEAEAAYILVKDTEITYYSRLKHIAYSLLKGRKYDEIESSVRPENCLSEWEWKHIIKIMEKYKDEENLVQIPTTPYPTTKQSVKIVSSN